MVDIASLVTVALVIMAAFAAGVWGWAIGRRDAQAAIQKDIANGFRILRHRLANEAAVKQAEQELARRAAARPNRGA